MISFFRLCIGTNIFKEVNVSSTSDDACVQDRLADVADRRRSSLVGSCGMAMDQQSWQTYYQKMSSDAENVDEEEEDFYGYGGGANGANGQHTSFGALPGRDGQNGTGNVRL